VQAYFGNRFDCLFHSLTELAFYSGPQGNPD